MFGDYKSPSKRVICRRGRERDSPRLSTFPSSYIACSYNRKTAVNLESRVAREEEGSRRVIKAQTSLIPGSCAKRRRRAGGWTRTRTRSGVTRMRARARGGKERKGIGLYARFSRFTETENGRSS